MEATGANGVSALPEDITRALNAISELTPRLAAKQWRGAWGASTSYAVGDLISHAGQTFFSLSNANRNHQPMISPSYWHAVRPVINRTITGMQSVAIGAGLSGNGTAASPLTATSNTFAGYARRYVHPSGSNSATGTIETPVRTISHAYNSLPSTGGVVLSAHDSKWSDGTEGLGLTDNQGIHLSGSYLPAGFLPYKQVQFRGYGPGTFGQLGIQACRVQGGSTSYNGAVSRLDPALWMIGIQIPSMISGLEFFASCPAKIGVDYWRDDSLNVIELPITAVSRINGQTTFTVTARSQPVKSFSRVGSTVRVTYDSVAYPVFRSFNMYATVDAGSLAALFDPGSFVVTNAGSNSATEHWFEYEQPGAAVSQTSSAGATAATNGLTAGDTQNVSVCELISSDPNFPSTMYLTTTIGPTTVICRDPYGGHHGRPATASAGAIGTMRVQFRNIGCTFDTIENSIFKCTFGGGEKFGQGPCVDKGDTNAGDWSWMRWCYLEGAIAEGGLPLAQQEEARQAAIFGCGFTGVAYNVSYVNTQGGNIYWPIMGGAGGPGVLNVDHVTQDTAIGTPIFPTLHTEYGAGGGIVDSVLAADQADLTAFDMGAGTFSFVVRNTITRTSLGNSQYSPPPVVFGNSTGGTNGWAQATKSYETMRITGVQFNDGHLAGKRDDVPASFGVYQGLSLTNRLPENVSSWTALGGCVVTPGQAAPDGSVRAFRLSGGGRLSVASDVLGVPAAALDDTWAFACWVKMDGGLPPNDNIAQLEYVTTAYWGAMFLYNPFGGDGEWKYVSIRGVSAKPNNVGATGALFTLWGSATGMAIYQPTLYFLPRAMYSANEQSRIAATINTRPAYLTNGSVGTAPGQKLIGHGGLGTAARYAVGSGSGRITLGALNGNAVEIFNEAGVSLGVLPLSAFTENP